jgi:Glycine zipper
MWIKQRPLTVLGLLVCSCLFGTGCQTPDNSNAVAGGVLGTGLGAVTGAIIGSATGRGNAAAGALIGAAAGGVGGALIGHSQDEKNQQVVQAAQSRYQQAQAAADQQAMTNPDVIYMVKGGVGEQVIANSIRTRGGRFDITPEGIVQLKANGVSDYLVQVMQTTPPPSAMVPPPGPPVYGPDGVVVAPAVGVVVEPRPYYYGWHRW